MPFFETTDGTAIHYQEMGQGMPIVFVHGWAMSGVVWMFQKELADRHRLIFMDLRGHGQSTGGDSLSLEALASDLMELFVTLDLRDTVLVGWSMGVQVVLQAFSSLRSRLAGLVLVGGTPRFTAAEGYPHGLPAIEVKGMALRLKRDYQKAMGAFFRSMFAAGEPEHDQYQRIIHDIVMKGRSPEPVVGLKALQILGEVDLRPVLASIDRPALLIHGRSDTICLPGASRFMAETMPMARLQLVDGGHAPFMARPSEFNAIVAQFAQELHERH